MYFQFPEQTCWLHLLNGGNALNFIQSFLNNRFMFTQSPLESKGWFDSNKTVSKETFQFLHTMTFNIWKALFCTVDYFIASILLQLKCTFAAKNSSSYETHMEILISNLLINDYITICNNLLSNKLCDKHLSSINPICRTKCEEYVLWVEATSKLLVLFSLCWIKPAIKCKQYRIMFTLKN